MEKYADLIDSIACFLFGTVSAIGSIVYTWDTMASFIPL
jgi:hypothetical protein